ncbi:DNA internalization-related competence protein ComEC/Rec2 [bacterium]|nr:DNA internalization-related competence protein ComEC/Rec2 [bacterium]
MRRPLVVLAPALAAGIAAGAAIDMRGLVAVTAAVAVLVAFLVSRRLPGKPPPPFVFAALAFALYGAFCSSDLAFTHPKAGDVAHYAGPSARTVTGLIVEGPSPTLDGRSFLIDARRIVLDAGAYIPARGRVRLSVSEGAEELRVGDLISFRARLRTPMPRGNPGAYRVDRHHRARGIDAVAYTTRGDRIEILARGEGSIFRRAVTAYRARIHDAIANALPPPQSDIVQALVLGERGDLPDSVRETYRDAGVVHLLAISGLHVGIVAGAAFALAFFLLRLSPRVLLATNAIKLAAAASAVPVLIYAVIGGGDVPVLRATIMVLAYLAALLVDRGRDFASAIALAALVILIVWPWALFEPGFQLSFAAVIGIAAITPRATQYLHDRRDEIRRAFPTTRDRAIDVFALACVVPLAATIATAPISAWHFRGAAVFGLAGNLLLVPLYTFVVVPLAFAGALLAPLSPVGPILAKPLWLLAMYAINTAHLVVVAVAALPGAYLRLGRPHPVEIVAWYGASAALLAWRRRAAKPALAICVAVLLAVPAAGAIARHRDAKLRVDFIDVGQGSAALIRLPDERAILVDGGGVAGTSFDVGEAIVLPYLLDHHVRALDLVVVTHPDFDHYGGLSAVIAALPAREVWISRETDDEGAETYGAFLRLVDRLRIPRRLAGRDTRPLEIAGARLSALWPPPELRDEETVSDNNAALVMRLDFGAASFLFPGDVDADIERELLDTGAPLAADVMLVPHHGSRSSSSAGFLAAVHPDTAVVPAGRDNRCHHPAPAVRARLEKAARALYVIGDDGRVTCETDGASVTCAPFFDKAEPAPSNRD